MPFAATTLDRVMGALELPMHPYYVERVQDGLDLAFMMGGEPTVTRIEGYLTKYEAQETLLNEGTDQAGLIRADVLEWAPGSKTSGVRSEMWRLRNLLAQSLNLDDLIARAGRVRLVRG